MNYLVVNHVPFAVANASAGTYRTAPAMLADLRAQSAALREAGGMRLIVAAPVVPASHVMAQGRCGSEPFVPDDAGFELIHLPAYRSTRDWLRVRRKLGAALRGAMPAGEIVQMGYGGHPVMLGEPAWPLASGRKRVWMFDDVDPFPAMQSAARAERNPVRRLAKLRRARHNLAFCRRAIREADLVFTHAPSVAERFSGEWDVSRCHRIDPPLVEDPDYLSEAELDAALRRRTDKSRSLRLAVFAPQGLGDPADLVVRALAHCRRLSVPVELHVIGPADEPATGALSRRADDLGMSDHLHAVPPYAAPAALDAFDAMVSTSAGGPAERATFAGMARGLPLVAFENPATDRLIELAGAGIVVPSGNVLLLAQAWTELHHRRPRLAGLGANAWRLAESRTRRAVHRRRAEIVAAMMSPAVA